MPSALAPGAVRAQSSAGIPALNAGGANFRGRGPIPRPRLHERLPRAGRELRTTAPLHDARAELAGKLLQYRPNEQNWVGLPGDR